MIRFLDGIRAYGKAWCILFNRKFRWFLLFPLVILTLLFLGGNWLVGYAGDGIYAWVEEPLKEWVSDISRLSWIGTATGWLIKIVLKIFYFLLFVSFGGYIVLIVMSPVYSWLSERTEAYLTGHKYPFSWKEFGWEIFRGILIVIRNMVVQLLLVGVLFLLSFIPLVGWLSPVVVFLVSAYFYGFSFVDYAIERKRYNVKQSVRYVNRNIGMVTGIGTVFALSLMISWLSLIACCYVSLLSVIAATVAVNEEEKKRKNKSS